MISYKRWIAVFLIIVLVLLAAAGGLTVVIDPLFHFHKPLSGISYRLDGDYERYFNNGILRHYDYDAIITGTSMTENFKTSEFDTLFNTQSVKVPFSGGSFREINDNLVQAVSYNHNIRYIVRSLDGSGLLDEKDALNTNFKYPTYLYDKNILNDICYIFNKEIWIDYTLQTVVDTMCQKPSDGFDEYANWMPYATFGKDAVDKKYQRPDPAEVETLMTDKDRKMMMENIYQNVTSLAKKNPQIEFYYFFPPYSIYWWDSLIQNKTFERQIEIFEETSELILEYDNIHLFSFFDEYDITCNLDNYKDIIHYGEWVNSQILQWMAEGSHQLTKENNQEYWKKIKEYYSEYDVEQH